MASPAEIANSLPETLPEDFGEWDGQGSPSAPPADTGVAEPSSAPAAAPKPAARPREPQVAAAPPTDAPRKTGSSTPVTVYGDNKVYQPRLRPAVDKSPSPASLRPANGRAGEAQPAHRTNGASSNGSGSNGSATNGHAHNGAAAHGAAANGAAVSARRAAASNAAAPASIAEADEVLFHSFRSTSVEVEEKKPATNKKWIMPAAVAAGCIVLLLAILIPVLHHSSSSAAKQPTTPTLTTTEMQLSENDKPSPVAATPSTAGKPAAAAAAQQPQQPAADSDTAADDSASNSVPVQSQVMNAQLSAPKVIPQTAGTANNEDAPPPPGFSGAGMQGLGDNNAMGNVFGGQGTLKVKAAPPKIVTVSSGVAVGMLVQKTAPVYPPIAKTAGVSGTVVLEAVISKAGTIEDLRIVSGPVMLRKAAEDAVRTWRYRPYKLNNEPTEVETTINVIFSLAS
jgi:TonB family protein